MIDIKELRIGSHINLCGERQRISAIDGLNQVVGIDAYKTDENGIKHPIGYKRADVEPIPLTSELLRELGFVVKSVEIFRNGLRSDYYIDRESAKLMENPDNRVIPTIEMFDYSKIGKPGLWEVRILSDYQGIVSNHETTVRYLHQLENFVYLTLGKELIDE